MNREERHFSKDWKHGRPTTKQRNTGKSIRRLSSFFKSQDKHRQLANKHLKKGNRLGFEYHLAVKEEQAQYRRMLTKAEKKRIYRYVYWNQ